jgi:S1-C subfamily serine protease
VWRAPTVLAALVLGAASAARADDAPPPLLDREDARALAVAIDAAARDVAPALVEVLIDRKPAAPSSDGSGDEPLRSILRHADPEALPDGDGPSCGIIVAADGIVLAPLYRVKDATRCRVRLASGAILEAAPLGTDERLKLAALKLPEGRYPAARFADERTLHVGELVVAVNAPGGAGAPVMRLGIVSALERAGGLMFETDAAIDAANAGGALVDLRGRVVGIPVLVSRQTGLDSGVGFVVKPGAVRAALPALREGERARAGFLGVTLGTDDGSGSGASIESVVEGTPASGAGLRAGDVVVEIDGRAVDGSYALRDQLTSRKAGAPVALTVRRGARTLDVRLTLAANPDE